MENLVINTSHDSKGFCCWCEALPGWTVSGSDDFDKFRRYVRESVDFYVKCARQDGDSYPPMLDGDYGLDFRFDTAAMLAYYRRVLSFAGLEALTGIKQRQLAHYAAGRSRPREAQRLKIENALRRLGSELSQVTISGGGR